MITITLSLWYISSLLQVQVPLKNIDDGTEKKKLSSGWLQRSLYSSPYVVHGDWWREKKLFSFPCHDMNSLPIRMLQVSSVLQPLPLPIDWVWDLRQINNGWTIDGLEDFPSKSVLIPKYHTYLPRKTNIVPRALNLFSFVNHIKLTFCSYIGWYSNWWCNLESPQQGLLLMKKQVLLVKGGSRHKVIRLV